MQYSHGYEAFLSLLSFALLFLTYFFINHFSPDLCLEEDLSHAMANCFEALLGECFKHSPRFKWNSFLKCSEFRLLRWLSLSRVSLRSWKKRDPRNKVGLRCFKPNLSCFVHLIIFASDDLKSQVCSLKLSSHDPSRIVAMSLIMLMLLLLFKVRCTWRVV